MEPRFLVVRDGSFRTDFYDVVVRWVGVNFPELAPLFERHDLPFVPHHWSAYVLHIPWLQDPVQHWSMAAYEGANALAAACDARGIPVVNRVDRLLHAAKSAAARTIADTGLRTPRMALVSDPEEFRETLLGLPLPLFVREDWGHGGAICRADSLEEVRKLPLESFERPVAVELVDVRDPRDGLFRKYRYVAAGDHGVSHHLQISGEWVTRGDNRVMTDAIRDEEIAYLAMQDPHHDALQRARRALGLDFVAFDYGYDRHGAIVVWEVNPFPHLRFSRQKYLHKNEALHRTLLAIVRMYLETASLPVPERLCEWLLYPPSG